MIAMGATKFVEVGPGKVLAGLVKRINKDVEVVNVNSVETLERIWTD
jgi:[acyl-carrier-protein] S-malonyltransferase